MHFIISGIVGRQVNHLVNQVKLFLVTAAFLLTAQIRLNISNNLERCTPKRVSYIYYCPV